MLGQLKRLIPLIIAPFLVNNQPTAQLDIGKDKGGSNYFLETDFKLEEQGQFFALSVKNISESSLWYQHNLGFKSINRMVSKDSMSITEILKSGTIVLEIVQQKKAISKDELIKQADFLWHGIFKIGFLVKELQNVLNHLKENKISIFISPVTDTENKIKFFMIRDNDGNIIQFIETIR